MIFHVLCEGQHLGGSADTGYIPLHAGGKWLRGRERCDEGRKRERKERGRKRVEPSAVLSVVPLSVISRVFFFFFITEQMLLTPVSS